MFQPSATLLETVATRADSRGLQLAERVAAVYVDIFALMREQLRRGMFAPDGLHPSATAYAEWADALRDRLPARRVSSP